ncbi:lytic transglycosylase domain-containing protein [Novispirillum itersonii]|uniref:lytic transglycosylase domain-containing protein n=1 Tax=Novispirillum itersonii TaxID=189 RepID=UPI00036FB648|nr:lytic transglycosylase domain-containing protein [Novispirillum itersonii]
MTDRLRAMPPKFLPTLSRPVLSRALLIPLLGGSLLIAPALSTGIGAAPAFLTATAQAAVLSDNDRQAYANAFDAAESGQWGRAEQWADQARSPVLRDVILGRSLAAAGNTPSFSALRDFIGDHPGWPEMATLKRRAEEVLTGQESAREVIDWFTANPPRTGHGKLMYAIALDTQGKRQQAIAVAQEAWHNESMSTPDKKKLLSEFGGNFTKADHQKRADVALWEGRTSDAREMMEQVDAGYKALIQARLAFQDGKGNVDALVKKVPASLAADPGLLFDRIQWRRKKDMDQDAVTLLKSPGADKAYPERWGKERLIISRNLLEQGLISQAYDVARRHRLSSGATYAELEWLAGWIVFRHLKDAKAGLAHFRAFEGAVSTTISVGRGAYWHGRAAEALGMTEQARAAYQKAADEGTTFYGQLASEKLRQPLTLPAAPLPSADDRAAFNRNPLVKIVQALGELDRNRDILLFSTRLVEDAPTPGQRTLALELGRAVGGIETGVALSRKAALKGHINLDIAYPLPGFDLPDSPEAALTLAIIRQESNFSSTAVSRVGAKGLMQLMPATAKGVAGKLGVGFQEASLTAEPRYNVRLGSSYLADLVDRFGGSYVMAIAGYNAGPGRPAKWVKEFGDPRVGEIDIIDWIEAIPFTETRNYVQRVLEGVQVYRFRLGHGDRSLRLSSDLR